MCTSRRGIPSIWVGHRLSEEVRRVGESYEKVDGESSDDLPDPVGQVRSGSPKSRTLGSWNCCCIVILAMHPYHPTRRQTVHIEVVLS